MPGAGMRLMVTMARLARRDNPQLPKEQRLAAAQKLHRDYVFSRIMGMALGIGLALVILIFGENLGIGSRIAIASGAGLFALFCWGFLNRKGIKKNKRIMEEIQAG